VTSLLPREVELNMMLNKLHEDVLVRYTSLKRGLPDAQQERHFKHSLEGFDYWLAVTFEPR
jgi:hypothetical protein